MSKNLVLTVVAGLPVVAAAQPSTWGVLWTDGTNQAVQYYSNDTMSTSSIISYAAMGVVPTETSEMTGIAYANGSIYTAFGDRMGFGPDQVFQIASPFGGPSSSVFSSDGALQSVIGMEFDRASQRLIGLNNAGASPSLSDGDRIEGFVAVNLANGMNTLLLETSDTANSDPRPVFDDPTDLIKGRGNTGYYTVTDNGGVDGLPGDAERSSTIYRFDPNTTALTLFADLSVSVTGVADLTTSRRITALGNGDLVITDQFTGRMFLLGVDASGNWDGSIDLIVDGFFAIGAVEYNRYTDQLVFLANASFVDADANGFDDDLGELYAINADGTGLTTLDTNVAGRFITIVPAPGAAAILGLGGLVATRRRR